MKAYIVEREALTHNIQAIKAHAGEAAVWAVLKGNGYGLGAAPMAKLMAENGIDRFAVTELREAQAIREVRPDAPILMLRSTQDPEEINALLDLHVILSIGSFETAQAVNKAAEARADVAEIHLIIDTGMGRYGFFPNQTEQLLQLFSEMKHLAVCGIFTHFHSAFCSKKATKKQYADFMQTVRSIQSAGFETGMIHCCNSAAFLNYPEMHLDAVRIGSAFLGRAFGAEKLGLKRIGYAECTVEELRTIGRGQSVGYGAGFVAGSNLRTAVISLGTFNGFYVGRENDLYRLRDSLRGMFSHFKNLFAKKWVIVSVNGHKCRVLGHIGMVHAVVDVTDIECAVGDPVTVEVNPLNVKGLKIIYK